MLLLSLIEVHHIFHILACTAQEMCSLHYREKFHIKSNWVSTSDNANYPPFVMLSLSDTPMSGKIFQKKVFILYDNRSDASGSNIMIMMVVWRALFLHQHQNISSYHDLCLINFHNGEREFDKKAGTLAEWPVIKA